MTWEADVREWLDGPMGKGMLRGEPEIVTPQTVVGPLLEEWAVRDAIDLVTETFAQDGTAHPAVVLLTKLAGSKGLSLLESAEIGTPQVTPDETAQRLADDALEPTVAALWWVTEAGSPAVFSVDVRFPPGHNAPTDDERQGGDVTAGSAPRIVRQVP